MAPSLPLPVAPSPSLYFAYALNRCADLVAISLASPMGSSVLTYIHIRLHLLKAVYRLKNTMTLYGKRAILILPKPYRRGYIMTNMLLRLESRPGILSIYIRNYGLKRAYWHLRDLGATRYSAMRSIFFAL